MKKICLVLGILSTLHGGSLFAQDEQKDEEKALTVELSGEIDGSLRNYSGDRFDYTDKSSAIAQIPCFDVWLEYQLAPKWLLTGEAEFISGAGIQVDEISLTREINPMFNIKGGLLQLPIGHCNSGYAYTDHFTIGDPEGEYAMLPCPMAELGLALSGEFDFGLDYQLSLTTGMNGLGASPYSWMQEAVQGFWDDNANFTSPAYSLKLGYTGIEGLTLNVGIYHADNIARNNSYFTAYQDFCSDNGMEYKKVPTTIWFADGEYAHDYFTIRASYLQGHLGGTTPYSAFLNTIADDEELDCADGLSLSKEVISYMGEVGLNLKNCFYPETKGPNLIPFAHYEFYNSQHKTEGEAIPGSKVNMWSFGCNWKPNDDLTIKLNYTTRKIDGGSKDGMPHMNEVNIGVAYDIEL